MKAIKYATLLLAAIPVLAFSQATSYDSDGDAVPDSIDRCLLVKGSAVFNGCPYAAKVTSSDRDGDGVADIDDKCAFMFGAKENGGCPDLGSLSESLKTEQAQNPMLFDTKTTTSTPSSVFATGSSTKAITSDEFKDQLLQVIHGSETDFTKLAVEKRKDGDAKARTCIAGAKECFVTAGKDVRYFAVIGNYNELSNALAYFDKMKTDIRVALGENEWSYTENMVPSRMAVYDAWRKAAQGEPTTHVAAYVKRADNSTYNVYMVIERDACCFASNE